MKRLIVLAVMFGLAALAARAQTVTGSGTTGNLSKFTGPSAIGNSVIVESDGNIGIGSASPTARLEVFDFNRVKALARYRNQQQPWEQGTCTCFSSWENIHLLVKAS